MRQRNILTNLLVTMMGLSFTLSTLTGCSEEIQPMPPVIELGIYMFEDISGAGIEYQHPDKDLEKAQCFQYKGNEQTITLRLKSITNPGISTPENFQVYIEGACNDKYEELSPDFYEIWADHENDEPVIKIRLKKNYTGAQRYIEMSITADPSIHDKIKGLERVKIYGAYVVIKQSPLDAKTETFSLKAIYKGMEYHTEASIDENGDMIFANPEYAELMQTIDAAPDVEMMVLDSETFYYYDAEDISNNMPYRDVMAIKPSPRQTRGADDFSPSYLGYVALYDNDHFEGRYISKGLENFHFTWDLPDLKDYDMNDKVTSIVTAFNSDDPLVCTVLTIWDDTDFNNRDNNSGKHRVSIVACRQAPVVAVEDLKKVKKIGSSKSWNDCISSISFHFGYIDRLMLDY